MARKKSAAAQATTEPTAPTPALPPPPPVGTFELVDRGRIKPAPWNPRKYFEPNALQELADSIRAQGLAEPLLVRRAGVDALELVAGERRLRAAELVELDQVPVIIRELTDEQAFDVALVENGQRRDLHPLEEADAFAVKRDRFHRSVEEVAAQVGHTTVYVRQRLKLTELVKPARAAFLEGKVSLGVALQLARIPDEKHQAQAAKDLASWRGGGEIATPNEARQHIRHRFMLDLSRATFPIDDALLVHAAGACTTCPKRTGNQRELFADVESGDLCTDQGCFRGKVDADWKRRSHYAVAAGTKVLSPEKSKEIWKSEYSSGDLRKAGYTDLSTTCYDDGKNRTYKQLLKGTKPAAIARNPHTGTVVELVETKGLSKLLVAAGHDFSKKKSSTSSSSGGDESWRKRQEAEKRARELKKKVVAQVIAQLVPVIEKGKSDKAFMKVLADAQLDGGIYGYEAIFRRRGQPERNVKKLQSYVDGLSENQLRGFLFELAIGDGTKGYASAYAPALLTACKAHGVDLKKLEAAEKAKVPVAKKAPPTTKKKVPMKRAAKKGAAVSEDLDGGDEE